MVSSDEFGRYSFKVTSETNSSRLVIDTVSARHSVALYNDKGAEINYTSMTERMGDDTTKPIYEKNEDGSYKLDEKGNQIPVYEKNEDGSYKLDEKGQKIPTYEKKSEAKRS